MKPEKDRMTIDGINQVIFDLQAHPRANETGILWDRIRLHAQVDPNPKPGLAYQTFDSIVVTDYQGRKLEELNAFLVKKSPWVALHELAGISARAPHVPTRPAILPGSSRI